MAVCDLCGFDNDLYTEMDRSGTMRSLEPMLRTTLETVPDNVQSQPQIAATTAAVEAAIAAVNATEAVDAMHDGIHHLRVLSRQLHEAGAGAPTDRGTVFHLATSNGGVPKAAVPAVDITRTGVVGDIQAKRKHHGKPLQAISLWSAEVIDDLVAEGHPITAGAAGENITLSGIDWSVLRPGVRLLVGDALLELSAWATPCRNNDQWFVGRSDRIDHDRHPGWSRAYAWVLEGGTVRVGDTVTVEP